jgi:hypothetical protein
MEIDQQQERHLLINLIILIIELKSPEFKGKSLP